MRIEELMVGDWVNIADKPVKLTKSDFGVMCCFNEEKDFHLSPIPLTDEILKNNGWRKRPQRYFDEWYGPIPLNEQGGKFYYAGIPLNYVHELQHLLRLCGGEKEITLTD